MKKIILKYLPIPIALIIALAGFLTLSYYTKNRSEYAVVSFVSKELSLDLTVSRTGFVTKILPANIESQEKLADFDIKGSHVADAVNELAKDTKKNETIFVGAYVHEDEDIEIKELNSLLEDVCSKLSVSYLSACGTYENYDFQRATAYKQTIGKVTFVKDYTDFLYSELNIYMDSLYVYEADPYDLAYYAEYIFEKNDIKNYKEHIFCDLSHYKNERKFLTEDEAEAQAVKYIQETFSTEVDSLSFSGYKMDRGYLAYAFEFRLNGENRLALVNIYDGTTCEYFLDDY